MPLRIIIIVIITPSRQETTTTTTIDFTNQQLDDYKTLLETLKADADYTYQQIKELAEEESPELSQKNPRLKKGFDRLLKDSKKHVQKLMKN